MNPRPKSRSSNSISSLFDAKPQQKMIRKFLIKPMLLLTLLFLLALSAFFSSNSSTRLSPLASPFQESQENFIQEFPKKFDSENVNVYMYGLPRKFTYGVIESYAKARNSDILKVKYPGNQHPAEWYLFDEMYRRNRSGGGGGGDYPVTRVMDPEEADLFYVPFFSSLSLVVNQVRPPGTDGPNVGYSDEAMQEELVEWLEEQGYWRRNNGWDHVFVCQDPNALHKVIDRVKNGVLLVSDFGRLGRDQASLVKDVILPYSHRIKSFTGDVGVESRKSLLFFMGNRYRKEGGKIRDLLFQLLEKEKDVVIKHGAQSRESRRAASQGMHTSKFCLHPAGDTPSACRLFDAIVSLCVPVIISDNIELPFEDVIDYRKTAVFVDTKSAVEPGYLVKLLRGISTEKILEYQQEMKKVQRYFEYEDPDGTVKEIWRQVSLKLPLIKLMINRDKRLVKRELAEPDCSCVCSNQSGISTTLS